MEFGRKAMWALLLISALLQTATATNYTVGNGAGWTFQTSNTEFYDQEFAGITLFVGDFLLFPYDNSQHSVYEVSQPDLAACNTASPIVRYTVSNAVVPLSTAGYHGFICGFTGHCASGMHLAVNVSAAATTPAPSTPPAVAPSPVPVTPPTSTPPPAPSTPAPAPTTPAPAPSTPAPAPTTPAPSPTTPAPTPSRVPSPTPSSSVPTPSTSRTPPAATSPPSSAEAPEPSTQGSGGLPSGVRSLGTVIAGTLLVAFAVLLQ